ncbi:MAG: hypothetical protein AB7T10_04655 [bacterium]
MNEILEEIKKGPYWQFRFYPAEIKNSEKNVIPSLKELNELIETSQVRLRGWYFPHINHEKFKPKENYYEIDTKYLETKEFWRFYQSGQFIMFTSIYEDVLVKQKRIPYWPPFNSNNPKGYVEFLISIYLITEFYLFTKRILDKVPQIQELNIELSINNIEGYELFSGEFKRELFNSYTSSSQIIRIPLKTLKRETLISSYSKIALDDVKYIFERFNWLEQPTLVFEEEQAKLLERRL